jgi:uncharacterized protein (TIGR03067 family)
MRSLIASITVFAAIAAVASAGGEKGAKIEGTWQATGAISRGKKVPQEEIQKAMVVVTFKDGKYSVNIGGMEAEAGTYKTDASKKPATIDLTVAKGPDKGKVQAGIYKVEGETLTMSVPQSTNKGGTPRPTTFDGTGPDDEVTIFKRAK